MSTLLTRKDAAKMLGISLVTLDSERAAGHLAYIQRKPGGKVWVTAEAIEDYLSRATHQARPQAKPVGIQTYRKRRA